MKLAFPVATPETADTTMLALRGPLEESFQLLARFGYDGAELMVRAPQRLNPDESRTLAAAINSPQLNIGTLRGQLPAPATERAQALAAARESVNELLNHAAAQRRRARTCRRPPPAIGCCG